MMNKINKILYIPLILTVFPINIEETYTLIFKTGCLLLLRNDILFSMKNNITAILNQLFDSDFCGIYTTKPILLFFFLFSIQQAFMLEPQIYRTSVFSSIIWVRDLFYKV